MMIFERTRVFDLSYKDNDLNNLTH